MSSQMIGDSSPAAFIDRRLNRASAYPASRSPPYCCWAASSGQLITEYAATSRWRSLAHATWSARHGLGWKPGPLVRPMTTYAASSVGIGAPVEILCGMPIPAGHCGHDTSPPSTPGSRGGSGCPNPLASAWAEAASDCAAEANPGSRPPLAVAVAAVAALGGVEGSADDDVSEDEQPADTKITMTNAPAARITPSPTPIRATRCRPC